MIEAERQGIDQGCLSEAVKKDIKLEVRESLAKWINTPSSAEQGYYPLHFASFHGNISLVKLLIRNKADWKVTARQGINMLHVAAQGD